MNFGNLCPLPLCTSIRNFRIYLYNVSLVVILLNWVRDNWVYRFPTIACSQIVCLGCGRAARWHQRQRAATLRASRGSRVVIVFSLTEGPLPDPTPTPPNTSGGPEQQHILLHDKSHVRAQNFGHNKPFPSSNILKKTQKSRHYMTLFCTIFRYATPRGHLKHPETDPKQTRNGPKQIRNGPKMDRNQALWVWDGYRVCRDGGGWGCKGKEREKETVTSLEICVGSGESRVPISLRV